MATAPEAGRPPAPSKQAPSAAAPSDPMLPEPFRIEARRQDTADTFTLELVPENGAREHLFWPGQFNMLYVFGVGEVPLSISGDPARPERLTHTVRAVGHVTRALGDLGPGAVVGVRGPFGRGWPLELARGRRVVVVAGGLGLAPLRPLLCRLAARRQRYRSVTLFYGARTPDDLLYGADLQRWQARADVDVQITVDRAPGSWRGAVGPVTTLLRRAPLEPAATIALLCGPEAMLRFSAQELLARGLGGGGMYLSMERSMKCALGVCGRCQFGPHLVCRDGPVFAYDRIARLLAVPEV